MNAKSKLELYSQYTKAPENAESLPTLVFLHGWGMHGDIFAQVVEKQAGQSNTLVIDLPGMGRSPMPEGEYNLDYLVQHISRSLEPYADQQLHLVGWSLGALIAAKLAASLKENFSIKSLFVVSMGPSFVADDQQSGMPQKDFQFFQAMLNEDFEGTLYRFLGLNTKGSDQQRAELRLLQQLVFSYGLPARKALAGGLDILGQEKLDQLLTDAAIPTTIVLGEKDALVPVEVQEAFHSHDYVKSIHVIPGAGHIPFLSHLDTFSDLLKQAL
ncbi:MAG TPA: hypothetical protein DHW71_05280 [Gammaproteobacteria bacterium]|nr:hypothetical protein [Gammaproteobacteria bacterium]HBF09089.1 hypothetical protein [Gammaproteobacteria bacterium]HCK92375.1 hypothetical protein [Gammaproteobacteria bacterium]|tara:strand:+ start:351 stop:1163 length:813 start_codon:yes stop_codon:yes gene_type:complete